MKTIKINYYTTEYKKYRDQFMLVYKREPKPTEIEAYFAGMVSGVTTFAAWKDGEQFCGVKRLPLREVIAQIVKADSEVTPKKISDLT